MNIYDLGKQLAEEFRSRGEDMFVEVVEVDGEEVTISVRYAPKQRRITNEDIWKSLVQQH